MRSLEVVPQFCVPLFNLYYVCCQKESNDDEQQRKGKEIVDKLTNSISIFENPALNFESNNSDGDDFLSVYNVGSVQFINKLDENEYSLYHRY